MFFRQELLDGLPARRASTVLFAIEAHTARLLASTRVSRVTYVGRRGAASEGRAASGPVRFGDLRRATFALADHGARELKVWVHRVTSDGETIGLPGSVRFHGTDGEPGLPLSPAGALVAAVDGGPLSVAVTVDARPERHRP